MFLLRKIKIINQTKKEPDFYTIYNRIVLLYLTLNSHQLKLSRKPPLPVNLK
jgi:hypothetical protein